MENMSGLRSRFEPFLRTERKAAQTVKEWERSTTSKKPNNQYLQREMHHEIGPVQNHHTDSTKKSH